MSISEAWFDGVSIAIQPRKQLQGGARSYKQSIQRQSSTPDNHKISLLVYEVIDLIVLLFISLGGLLRNGRCAKFMSKAPGFSPRTIHFTTMSWN